MFPVFSQNLAMLSMVIVSVNDREGTAGQLDAGERHSEKRQSYLRTTPDTKLNLVDVVRPAVVQRPFGDPANHSSRP